MPRLNKREEVVVMQAPLSLAGFDDEIKGLCKATGVKGVATRVVTYSHDLILLHLGLKNEDEVKDLPANMRVLENQIVVKINTYKNFDDGFLKRMGDAILKGEQIAFTT